MAETKQATKKEEQEGVKQEKAHGNIYEKMATVKTKLIGTKKGGESNYIKGGYFELADILPILTPALKEERLFMQTQFSATEQIAKLIIIDIDKPESKIEYETKFIECNIKGIHEIQNLGATQTYIRRYLILTAFDISDGDILDSTKTEIDEKKAAERKEDEQKKADEKKAKAQQEEEVKKQQAKELENLKRSSWELIKQLPEDERAKYVKKCEGADADKLKEIIQEVDALIKKPTKPSEPNQGETQAPEKKDGELEIY